MLFTIKAVNNVVGNNYFRVLGEYASAFPAGSHIQIRNSTGNNGIYQIAGATDESGFTHITVVEPIPSGIADGQLHGGVYQIDFSDATIAGKAPIILAPSVIDSSSTSIALPARGAWDYGERLVENTIHMLENFASRTAPVNPTIGQQWFDYNTLTMKTFVDGQWSSDVNIESGVLSFKDPQNVTPNSKVFITAAEPAGKTATGLTIYPEHDVAANSPVFRVLSSAGNVHLAVERANAIRTDLRFIADSAATSEFKGKVSIGTPTNAYSTGSSTNIKGHVDLSGKLIIDEAAAEHGLFGRTSAASIKIVSGLWTVTTAGADAASFVNSAGEVARLGANIVFARPTAINNTLDVTGSTTLSTTTVNGMLTADDATVPGTATVATLVVAGALSASPSGTQLLADLNANNFKVVNLAAPVANTDAATKKYVDDNDYLTLMADVTISTPSDKQVLYYNSAASKWVNATLDSSYISGFNGDVKDQAAAVITGGSHVGLSTTYDSGAKTLDIVMDSRPVNLTGSVLATGTIDWTGTTSIATTLAATGVAAGTYTKVTIGADGRVLVGGTVSPSDIAPGSYNLQNTYKVYNAIDPVDAGDYVTLRFLENYTFDAGTF